MKFLVLGAGKMGLGVAFDLARSSDASEIWVADSDFKKCQQLQRKIRDSKIKIARLNVEHKSATLKLFKKVNCVISAVTYFYNLELTKWSIQSRTHFCDMGGNVDIVKKQHQLHSRAQRAGITIIPDCGLAPGIADIVAYHGFQKLDRVDSIKIRVGGLSQNPKPPLEYQLLFSVDGLINEYYEDAVILENGQPKVVESLTGLEEIYFPSPFGKLEAFYTSGGSSTLVKTLAGKISSLDYKTIRYPGHCAKVKILKDLGLMETKPVKFNGIKVIPRHLLAKFLSNNLSFKNKDVVLMRVIVSGVQNERRKEIVFEMIDHYDEKNNLTSMQRTTAFPVSIIAQMLAKNEIQKKGVIPQELAIPAEKFFRELRLRAININESVKEF